MDMEAQNFLNTLNNKIDLSCTSHLAKDIFLPPNSQNEIRLDTGINLLQKFKKDLIDILGKDFDAENDAEQKAFRSMNTDIAYFIDHKITDDQLKLLSLNSVYIPPENFTFPITILKSGQKRVQFRPKWLTKWRWLAYSPSKDGAYCKYCVFFNGKRPAKIKIEKLITKPYTNWKKVYENFNHHEKNEYHKMAESELFILRPDLARIKESDDAAKAAAAAASGSNTNNNNNNVTGGGGNNKRSQSELKNFTRVITGGSAGAASGGDACKSASLGGPGMDQSALPTPVVYHQNDIVHYVNKISTTACTADNNYNKLQVFFSLYTPPIDYAFPRDGGNKKRPRFQYLWFTRWLWLAYSPAENGAYCKYCVFFSSPTHLTSPGSAPTPGGSGSGGTPTKLARKSTTTKALKNDTFSANNNNTTAPYPYPTNNNSFNRAAMVGLGGNNNYNNGMMFSSADSFYSKPGGPNSGVSDFSKAVTGGGTTKKQSVHAANAAKNALISLVHKPYRNWKKAIEHFTNHEATDVHKLSICTFLSVRGGGQLPCSSSIMDDHGSTSNSNLMLNYNPEIHNPLFPSAAGTNMINQMVDGMDNNSCNSIRQNHIIQALLRSHHHPHISVAGSDGEQLNDVFSSSALSPPTPTQHSEQLQHQQQLTSANNASTSTTAATSPSGPHHKRPLEDSVDSNEGDGFGGKVIKTEFTVAGVGMEQISHYLGATAAAAAAAAQTHAGTFFLSRHQRPDTTSFLHQHYQNQQHSQLPHHIINTTNHHLTSSPPPPISYHHNHPNSADYQHVSTCPGPPDPHHHHFLHSQILQQFHQQQQQQQHEVHNLLQQQQQQRQQQQQQQSASENSPNHHSSCSVINKRGGGGGNEDAAPPPSSQTSHHFQGQQQLPPPPSSPTSQIIITNTTSLSPLIHQQQLNAQQQQNQLSTERRLSSSASGGGGGNCHHSSSTIAAASSAAVVLPLSNIPLPFVRAAAAAAAAAGNNIVVGHVFENLRSTNEFINL